VRCIRHAIKHTTKHPALANRPSACAHVIYFFVLSKSNTENNGWGAHIACQWQLSSTYNFHSVFGRYSSDLSGELVPRTIEEGDSVARLDTKN
jgi:hypothetical protein